MPSITGIIRRPQARHAVSTRSNGLSWTLSMLGARKVTVEEAIRSMCSRSLLFTGLALRTSPKYWAGDRRCVVIQTCIVWNGVPVIHSPVIRSLRPPKYVAA